MKRTGVPRNWENCQSTGAVARRAARKPLRPTDLDLLGHLKFPVEIEGILAAKSSVLSVEVAQFDVGRTHVRHYATLCVEAPGRTRIEDREKETKANYRRQN